MHVHPKEIGYTKKYEHHKEGDIWEEDGSTVDY